VTFGECRLPCGADDTCPVRGGLPHTCFVRGDSKSCYPGLLGITCQRSSECMPGTTCEDLPPERRLAPGDAGTPATTRVCAHRCATDVDCLDAWDNQEGFCEDGWCRLGDTAGGPCDRDQECGAGHCQVGDGSALGHCVY
jgi:hypothetical protein